MSKLEGHITELEIILKRIREMGNHNVQTSYEPGQLFSLKMHQQDMILLHQMAIERINELMKIEEESEKQPTIKQNVDYRNKELWRKQVEVILHEKDHPLKSTDIIDNYKINPAERRQCMFILSNVLGELCDRGVIKKFKIEGEKGFYYALPHMTLKKAD